jgi:hypothetical protein
MLTSDRAIFRRVVWYALFGAVLTFVLALSTGSVLIYIAGGMAMAALMTAVEVRVRVRLENVRAPRAKLTLGSSAPDRSVLDRHYLLIRGISDLTLTACAIVLWLTGHHILGIAFFGLLALEVFRSSRSRSRRDGCARTAAIAEATSQRRLGQRPYAWSSSQRRTAGLL